MIHSKVKYIIYHIKPACAGNALLISRIFVQNKIARLYAGEQFCYCIEVI